MALEIERKFLVDPAKWQALKKPKGTHYRQGYLADNMNITFRVRVAGKQGFITIKGATQGIVRKEYEYKIPAKQATELLDNFAPSSIEKTRYKIKFGRKTWEIDEFGGDNQGLEHRSGVQGAPAPADVSA